MHDHFYVIHKINNPRGMVRGDGGFTEGMLFVIFFHQGDAIPPHPPSIRALYRPIYTVYSYTFSSGTKAVRKALTVAVLH